MLKVGITGFEGLASIEPEQLTVRVTRALIPIWRASMKEFVRATAESMVIDTGMSIASLRPLAADIRFKGNLEAIISGKGIKRSTSNKYQSHQFPGPNQKKSASLGERMGSNAYDYSFDNNNYRFSFNIVVLQHHLNDNGLGHFNKQALDSIQHGEQAFTDYWEEHSAYVVSNTIETFFNHV